MVDAGSGAGDISIKLGRDEVKQHIPMPKINEDICAGSNCNDCVYVCPYGALYFDETGGPVKVDESLCRGCGICSATCASGASQLEGHDDL